MLTLLCILQFLLAGAAVMLGLRLDDRTQGGREATLLAIVHAVPVPVLVIARLRWEQSVLALTPGTRPETIARQIGPAAMEA